MSNPSNQFSDSRLAKELSALRNMPPRDPEAAQRGRNRFLSEAKSMGEAVSPSQNMRHSITNANKFWAFLLGKTNARLAISPILGIVLAIALVLGGTGTTVVASQTSQPDQLLYPVKLWTEDVRLQWTSDPLTRIQLDQEFADRRVNEIAWMVQSGKEIDESLTNRLEILMDDALVLATTLDNKGQAQALESLKTSFLHQQAQLAELKNKTDPQSVRQVARLTTMLDLGLQLAETGIRDPEALRKLYKETVHPGKPTEVQASSTAEMTDTSEPTQTPGEKEKDTATKDPGPQVTHTPKPPVDTPDNKPATKTPKPPVDTPDNKPATKTPKPAVDTPDVKPTKPPADTPDVKPTKPPADTQAPAKTKSK